MNIEQFYKDNYKLYVKRLSRKAGGVENAEDIVQEAFCRALKYQDSFNPMGDSDRPFEIWFNTIVRRAMYDFNRTELKQGMTAAIDSGEAEAVEVDCADQVMAEEILEAIKNKPKNEHRQVLYLALVKNYLPGDIVQVLDIPLTQIKTIVSRFKIEMAEKYDYDRETKTFS